MASEPGDDLSTLDQHVLLAIMRLAPDAYGLSIRDEISSRTGREIPAGTIYARIERLEDRKYISSREGEPIAKRGGRRKLFFTINGQGRSALSRALRDTDNLREGVLVGRYIA